MKLPERIKVAAFDIKIITFPDREAELRQLFGEFSALDQTIRIDSKIVGTIKGIDTLIHELNHAIYWAYGIYDEDKEERIVGAFATAWTQIYRDNPELLEFIKAGLS